MVFSLPKINYIYYAYSNARVYGMKGLLLTKGDYAELVNLKSVDSIIEFLQKTHYKSYLLDAVAKYEGSLLLESASSQHFADIVRKLRKLTPKENKGVLEAILVKWDLINLNLVVSSKRGSVSFNQIKPKIVPVGSIPVESLESIFNANEMDLINEIKKTEIGSEIFSKSTYSLSKELLSRFKKASTSFDQNTQVQILLDNYSYILMIDHLKPYLSEKDIKKVYNVIQKEITKKDILIIERLKRSGIKSEDEILPHMIQGGFLDPREKTQLISSEKFEDSFPTIKKVFPSFKGENVSDMISLETELQKAISVEKIKMFHGSILSIGTILGFLLIKEEEINNLRKIARAKEFGLSPKEIMDSLIFIGE
ncbi:MAG: V-type ATPase subunit [Candidatus Micrarchaeia archaeon]